MRGVLTAVAGPVNFSDIAEKLNHDIVDILRTPAFRDILLAQGAEAAPGTPAELTAFMASETRRLKNLIETSGLVAK